MADESPKQPQPQAQPKAGGEPPKAAQQSPNVGAEDKSSADQPDAGASQQKSGVQAKPLDLAAPKSGAPMTETRRASLAAGEQSMKAARRGQPKMPSAAELRDIRKDHFGGKPGTVRVDAPPPGSRVEDAVTRLVFFDEHGNKVGEQEYHGPDESEG
jgi:hypothetical protein